MCSSEMMGKFKRIIILIHDIDAVDGKSSDDRESSYFLILVLLTTDPVFRLIHDKDYSMIELFQIN